MGTVHKFRRPPKNSGQFRGYRPNPQPGGPRSPRGGRPGRKTLLIVAAVVLATLGASYWLSADAGPPIFLCESPRVTDGDTIRCGSQRVRLAGIDAPEMPGHCRQGRDCAPGDPQASKANLERLAGDGPLKCRAIETDRYGRTVAQCSRGGVDLSCQQVADGQAIKRYRKIEC